MSFNLFKTEFHKEITIQHFGDGRHGYFKIPTSFICDLDIEERVSESSFLGDGDKPWNKRGFAYIEEDSDYSLFMKACEFWGIEVTIDEDTLQQIFDDECEEPSEWKYEEDEEGEMLLLPFCTENLQYQCIDKEVYPEDFKKYDELKKFLNKSQEDDDELPDNSDSGD